MRAPLGELFAELSAVKLESANASKSEVKTVSAPEAQPAPKQEKVAESAPPKPKVKKKLPSLGFSIRGKSNKAAEKESAEANDSVAEPEGNRPLDITEVEAKWRTFARAQENFAEQTLLSAIPRVESENVITVPLQNKFQKQTIEEVQQTLIPYLRKQLHNSQVTLNLTVSADLESTRAYTPHEKLTEMIKEQPELKLLIERFNLEIE